MNAHDGSRYGHACQLALVVARVTDVWDTTNADVTASAAPELLFATESQVWTATVEEHVGVARTWNWRTVQRVLNGPRYEAMAAGNVVTGDFNGDGSTDLAYVSNGAVYVRKHL